MKRITTILTALLLVVVSVFAVACAEKIDDGAHVCQRKCEECGLCQNPDCTEEVCQKKCAGHATQKYSFTVLSVNLDQGLADDAGVRTRCANRIVAADPDFFGVQEENVTWQEYLTDVMGENGYEHVVVYRGGPNGYDEAGGIFYKVDRFNLVKSGAFWLSDTPDVVGSVATSWGEDTFPRVCTWVVLQDKLSGLEFGYFNTHLSYYADKPQIRIKSAQLIAAKIAEIVPNKPAFVSGDMNFASNVEPNTYAAFTDNFVDTKSIVAESEWTNTFNNYGSDTENGKPIPTVPIDYIFVTKDLFSLKSFELLPEENADQLVVGDPSSGWTSDHYPIKAVVEFTKGDVDKTK